jgi:hypothetical protein
MMVNGLVVVTTYIAAIPPAALDTFDIAQRTKIAMVQRLIASGLKSERLCT